MNKSSPRALMPFAYPCGRGQPEGCKISFCPGRAGKTSIGLSANCGSYEIDSENKKRRFANFTRQRSRRKSAGVRIGGTPPQFEALQLAGLGPREFRNVLDGARVFIGRDRCLDEILQGPRERRISAKSLFQYDIGFHDLTSFRVG